MTLILTEQQVGSYPKLGKVNETWRQRRIREATVPSCMISLVGSYVRYSKSTTFPLPPSVAKNPVMRFVNDLAVAN